MRSTKKECQNSSSRSRKGKRGEKQIDKKREPSNEGTDKRTIADEGVKCLFDDELSVEYDEFGTDWDQVIAAVVFEELDKDEVLLVRTAVQSRDSAAFVVVVQRVRAFEDVHNRPCHITWSPVVPWILTVGVREVRIIGHVGDGTEV